MTLPQMLEAFKTFDPVRAAGDAMTNNEQAILDINREQLYEHGEGYDGVQLPPYQSPPYARKKERMRGKSIVDIYLKGNLQDEMELKVEYDKFSIFSKVPYAQHVVGRRPTVFGLTEDGKHTAWQIISGDFVTSLQEHINNF